MAALVVVALAAAFSVLLVSGFDVPTITFDEGFSPLFGEANMEQSPDGRTVRLTLNRYSGSGFISSDYYHHGFFSANVRLPKDHTAGVVVAFYVSDLASFSFFLSRAFIRTQSRAEVVSSKVHMTRLIASVLIVDMMNDSISISLLASISKGIIIKKRN
jgi:hypothetical protein